MNNIFLAPILSLLLVLPGQEVKGIEDSIKSIVNENYLEAQALKANVPGVLVGVWDYNRGVNMVYGVGVADKNTGELLDWRHSFKIASVTKTMVATVIVQLIDEGKLSFSTPVSHFFPDLPEASKVTIRMLGDMTSGYFDYLEDETFLDNFDNTPYFTATPEEMIEVAMSHPMEYPPGTGFNYSNTNTVILGRIVERITGNSLEQELARRLFTPLNLEKTAAPSSGSYLPLPKAHSYHPDTLEDWTDKMDYSPEYACGNAYTTMFELRSWIESLAKGTLIDKSSYGSLFAFGTPFPGAEDYVYHFGIIDYKGFLGHSGDTDYYLTEAYYNPEINTTLIILSNSSVSGFTGLLLKEITDLLLAQAPERHKKAETAALSSNVSQ